MDKGRWAKLRDRGVVAVSGEDAQHFLHNLVTNNIERLEPGSAGYGALLTPQGKVQFDFIVLAADGQYLFDLPAGLVDNFMQRLMLHRLRAKVSIEARPDLEVVAAWETETAPAGFFADPRLPALGFRRIAAPSGTTLPGTEGDGAAYSQHRIALGVPEGGADFAYGDAFPHDANIDQLGGVDFAKGCYVGQEVVSRMRHRGTARRRIVRVEGERLSSGDEIADGTLPVGTIGSAAGNRGLALVRLDRAAEAIAAGRALTAGGIAVTLTVPEWASFDLKPPTES